MCKDRRSDALFDGEALDELDLARLYSITGDHFDPLSACFQGLSADKCQDTFVAEVTVGGAPGLYTIAEAIVMRGEEGQLWAAYIDAEANVVRYFTTERKWRNRLPKTIEHWRSRFSDKSVIFDTPVDPIPQRGLSDEGMKKIVSGLEAIRSEGDKDES